MENPLQQGILVAIEGIDGAGKTTQAQRLQQRLDRAGFSVIRTKEPTDGPWGTLLRKSAKTGRLSVQEELQAFIEDRKEHVTTTIRPALEQAKVVIVDRYYFSTAAYQGALGLDPQTLLQQNESFAPIPDLLVYLQVTETLGLSRIRKRDGNENLFEREENLKLVRRVFDSLERPYVMRLDGSMQIEALTDNIIRSLIDRVLIKQLCVEKDKSTCQLAQCTSHLNGVCSLGKIVPSLFAPKGEV